jgi:hypothetical protein
VLDAGLERFNAKLRASFKYGDMERMKEERFFNDMNEATLGLFLGGHLRP